MPRPTNTTYQKRAATGRRGEMAAASFLSAQGYIILACNWRAGRFAEVDLIAQSPQQELVFIEVKTRTNNIDNYRAGFESVHALKQHKILTAARIYLSQTSVTDIACRFDVIVVHLQNNYNPTKPSATIANPANLQDQKMEIIHVQNAFSL